ncbi:MAG: HD domain-containing protein [Bacteroidetes bacterium]|nr:HD domain-containing protein [Bacteroidota bacterium]
MSEKLIMLSDPVHGFIEVEDRFIQDLIKTREVQRLRRIKQLGMGFIVYPSAEHSRFPHALGAMGLLKDALDYIESKGTPISDNERLASLAAILLHDIGHAPFSHTLESQLISKASHEKISVALIKHIQSDMVPDSNDYGLLDLALKISNKTYHRPFFHQLISGQFDMDRLDYLRRDSQLTGVVEGKIGIDRILRTLCVHPKEGGTDSCLAIESKGVYTIGNVLIARRLMYQQVYLHKTVIAADCVLRGAIKRAKYLTNNGKDVAVRDISPSLQYFLKNDVTKEMLSDQKVLDHFLNLDDAEIICSLKKWQNSPDKILADLSDRFISRNLFRCVFLKKNPPQKIEDSWVEKVTKFLKKTKGITSTDIPKYYLHSCITGRSTDDDLDRKDDIPVLTSDGKISSLNDYAAWTSITAPTDYPQIPYVAYPKEVHLDLEEWTDDVPHYT